MPANWVWDKISDYRLDREIIVDFLKEIFERRDENDFEVYVGPSSEQKH